MRWTKEEDNLIIKLRQEGKTTKEMCEFLPMRSDSSIRGRASVICPLIRFKWSEEKDNQLLKLRSTGMKNKEIAEILGTTASAIAGRVSKLRKEGKIEATEAAFIWTQEQENKLIELRNKGMQTQDIAKEINVPLNFVRGKCSRLVQDNIVIKTSSQNYWSDEEDLYLSELRDLNYSRNEIAEKLGRTVPSVGMRISRLIKTGALDSKKTMPQGKCKLYIVHFIEEDFYKIGITQRTVQDRFYSIYPEYEIIKELQFETLQQAKEIEKKLLKILNKHKYTPLNIPNGQTECFQVPNLKTFDDFLALVQDNLQYLS